ncbi:PREDICTED: ileal sodium/bile acid cotransporter-like isoform X2 [Priapulus caudatus]|uniref:Ileal sodium/bile acid cotransporter-like isoform X2 n=1 Tax=Priapulus caudatus TaxID=37621 RepID=A0ABM1DVJ1_PRICU|nr:PREDICTED: ileal sodium/bile acid cotransporter-like isoform X2 [Priapulus caudatus]
MKALTMLRDPKPMNRLIYQSYNVAFSGTMPMWLTLLGKYFTEGTNLRIPFVNIILGLSYMIGPVGIGLVIKIYRPTWAAFMMRILKPCCAILVVILIVTGVYSSWYIFSLVTPLIVAVASSLPWLGFTMGGLVAIITRRPWPIVKTIAIETGFQNAGIALVLLRSTFPQPEADLAAVVPIICTILTPLPLIVIFIVRLVVMRIRGESTSADLTADKAKSKSNLAVKPESYVPHVDNDKMAEKEKETQRSEHGTENGNASTAVEMEVKKHKSPTAKDIKEKVGQANPALADDDWTEEDESRMEDATSMQQR